MRTENLILEARWPTMDGRTIENRREFTAAERPGILRIFVTGFDRSLIPAGTGLLISLKEYVENNGPLVARTTSDGLDHLIPVRQGVGRMLLELFVERTADGELISFISCTVDESTQTPECTLWFTISEQLGVFVVFAKPLFAEWREIRSSVGALIEQFENPNAASGERVSASRDPVAPQKPTYPRLSPRTNDFRLWWPPKEGMPLPDGYPTGRPTQFVDRIPRERWSSYDPAACATDPGGMIYIALGRRVFRFPARGGGGSTNLLAKHHPQRLIEPTDPDEPSGCPENPSQTGSIPMDHEYRPASGSEDQRKPPYGTPRYIGVVATKPNSWGLQLSAEDFFDRTCQRAGNLREELPNGLIACRWRPDDSSIPVAHWGVHYMAKPEVYAAPLGRPFVIACRSTAAPGTHICKVSYKLYDTLNVFYDFYPHRLPISDIVAFDRGLRAKIEAAAVEDFTWPDELTTTGMRGTAVEDRLDRH